MHVLTLVSRLKVKWADVNDSRCSPKMVNYYYLYDHYSGEVQSFVLEFMLRIEIHRNQFI